MRPLLASALLLGASAWVLPGTAPQQFQDGQFVPLKVNKLTSVKTHLGYAHYTLPFCKPETIENAAENLGEHLAGDTIQNSPYELMMKVNQTCKLLCTKGVDKGEAALSTDDIALLVKRINEQYSVNWMVDNLPAAGIHLLEHNAVLYGGGLPIGGVFSDNGATFLYNHHRMTVKYHEDPSYTGARVVGFDVQPMSIHQTEKVNDKCDSANGNGMDPSQVWPPLVIAGQGAVTAPAKVTFSYDAYWVPSDVQWASRWDVYLSMGGAGRDEVHWMSIIYSFVITLLMTGVTAMVMLRALRADIDKYNRVMTEEEKAEAEEERGWKLVHGDVFRPPTRFPMLFSVLSGIGAQLFCMAAATIVFAAIGFLSPANRGYLMIALVLLWLGFGVVAGYTTARVYKMFNGVQWHRAWLLTAFGFPAFIFTVLIIINGCVWSLGSTNAIPFLSMLAVLFIWLGLSVPLTFLGAKAGFKADKIEFPVRVSAMPRQIPKQPWFLQPLVALAVGGALPFGTVYVELFFILNSLWMDQYYYVFGFLLLVFVLLAITCAEISIVMTYLQLGAEDYRWWWRSALIPGASGVYLYAYCIYFFLARLEIEETVPQLLYFGYMGLVALAFSFITGIVGFLATLWFNRTIYSAVKVD